MNQAAITIDAQRGVGLGAGLHGDAQIKRFSLTQVGGRVQRAEQHFGSLRRAAQ